MFTNFGPRDKRSELDGIVYSEVVMAWSNGRGSVLITAILCKYNTNVQVLQSQLQLLQKPKAEKSMDVGLTAPSDSKGKTVVSSSSSISDCGQHEDIEEIKT